LKFVRIEPYVIPKKSLTGDNTERVDTRVLQVIYAVDGGNKRLFVGQQVDVFIDATSETTHEAKNSITP
jgi:HlyD family secretion protein